MTETDDGAYVVLPRSEVPKPWLKRARTVALVPLLPDELAAVLSGKPASPQLEERDEEIARLVIRGASLADIGRSVGLSPRGVQHRLASLRRSFGARTTAELAAHLARHGIGLAQNDKDPPQES